MKRRNLFGAWLLTPIAVWFGTSLLGWLGARIGGTLVWMVASGLVGGVIGLAGWVLLVLFFERRQARSSADKGT